MATGSAAGAGAGVAKPAALSPVASASPIAAVAAAVRAGRESTPFALDKHTVSYAAAGFAARVTGAVLTSPVDTLKTRLQFEQRVTGVRQDLTSRTLVQSAAAIYRREGVSAFYKGLPVRLVYIGPAAAVSFVFYEQFRYLYRLPDHSAGNKFLWFVPLALGGVARVAGTALRTPFDVLRQRMQIQGGLQVWKPHNAYGTAATATASATASAANTTNTAAAANATNSAAAHGGRTLATTTVSAAGSAALPRGIYSGMTDALQKMFRTEGVRAFWSGFGATILRDIPFAAVYFLSYETLKDVQSRAHAWLTHSVRDHHFPPHTAAGTGARTTTGATAPPVAPAAAAAAGPTAAAKAAAVAPAAARAAASIAVPGPASPVVHAGVESDRRLRTGNFFLAGAGAAACAVTVTMPLDVVKTRLQTQGALDAASRGRYKGVYHCFQTIVKEDGARGLFRGFSARLLYLCPSAAITFACYEFYKGLVRRFVEPQH